MEMAVGVTSDRAVYYKDFISHQLHVVVNLAPIYKQVGSYACPAAHQSMTRTLQEIISSTMPSLLYQQLLKYQQLCYSNC